MTIVYVTFIALSFALAIYSGNLDVFIVGLSVGFVIGTVYTMVKRK